MTLDQIGVCLFLLLGAIPIVVLLLVINNDINKHNKRVDDYFKNRKPIKCPYTGKDLGLGRDKDYYKL